LEFDPTTVRKWHRCFVAKRVDGLHDEHRPGAPRTITDDRIEGVIVGIEVQHIWRAFGLQPHRSETFKLSTDPLFVEKVRDVVAFMLRRPSMRRALR
jgi:hypothetical protein